MCSNALSGLLFPSITDAPQERMVYVSTMAESVVLIKHTEEYPLASESRLMQVERIVGIEADYAPTLIEQNYHLTGNETEEPISLPADSLARLYEFYRLCRANSTDRCYDCTSFGAFVSGVRDDISIRRGLFRPPIKMTGEVSVNAVEAGMTYAVARDPKRFRTITHVILGVLHNTNLSVNGVRMPLYLTRNEDIVPAYKGTGLLKILMLR